MNPGARRKKCTFSNKEIGHFLIFIYGFIHRENAIFYSSELFSIICRKWRFTVERISIILKTMFASSEKYVSAHLYGETSYPTIFGLGDVPRQREDGMPAGPQQRKEVHGIENPCFTL